MSEETTDTFAERMRRAWSGFMLKPAPIVVRTIPAPTPAPKPTAVPPRHGKRLRLSKDEETTSAGFGQVIEEPQAEREWHDYDLSDSTLSRIDIPELIELLVDISPEVSRALWDFLRMTNPGWTCTVCRPGTETADPKGQAVVDEFLARLKTLYGAVDVTLARMLIGGFIRGGFLAEVVLDSSGKVALDLATPDPDVISFKKVNDRERGEYWQLGQYQGGNFVPFDKYTTIRYVPIDPLPGSPYGRSMVSPAVFLAVFAIGLLRDLRRVVAQQGYPRLDIEVILETLMESAPEDVKEDAAKTKNWIESVITEISSVYEELQPDDAFVHTDVVKVNRPVGAIAGDGAFAGSISTIITSLERMLTRSLKSMPILMGTTQSTSETQANREWEIHAQGIKALQHLAEQMLEHLLGVVLSAAGLQGTVKFRFAELRASEELRDAQTLAMKIANAYNMWLYGYLSQDQASQYVTGHEADAALPRLPIPGTDQNLFSQPINDSLDRANPGQNLYQLFRIRTETSNGVNHANGVNHTP